MFRLGNVVIVLFLLLIPVVYRVSAFTLRSGAPSASGRPLVPQSFAPFRRPTMCLWDAITPVDDEDDDEDDDENEEIEPGEMRVSEIKAELDLRGVEYKDCFDKESLSQRLMEARVSGKADPKILEKFNRAKVCQGTLNGELLEFRYAI